MLAGLPGSLWSAGPMGALSLLPAFLFWPTGRRLFLAPLRAYDRDAVIESWLEAGEAARPLLGASFGRLEKGLKRAPRGLRAYVGGLGKPAIFAFVSLLLLQALSLALLSKPLLVWEGPETRAASGLKLDEALRQAAPVGAQPKPQGALRESPEGEGSTAEEARRAAALAEGEGKLNLPREGGIELPGAPGPTSLLNEEGPTQTPDLGRSQQSSPEADRGLGRPQEGEAPQPPGSPENRKGITGFEGTGASNVPSPLLDYRSRLLKILSAKEGGERRASGGLVTKDFPELARRYFSSFALGTGIGPREDDWTSQLRRRWAELLSASELKP